MALGVCQAPWYCGEWDIITYEKQSLFTPLFRDVLWTHVASDLQQWPFGERHCNQDNGPDHSTACQLRLGFARTTGCDVCVMVSKAQESIHARALLWIPMPRVYACVCVCLCVCVCDSKPAVKVYCTWWWNDDNSLVFSEETVKFSADFNSFRRKFEEFDDSKRIVCNQMVATREDPAPLCSRAIRRLVDNFATRSDT